MNEFAQQVITVLALGLGVTMLLLILAIAQIARLERLMKARREADPVVRRLIRDQRHAL